MQNIKNYKRISLMLVVIILLQITLPLITIILETDLTIISKAQEEQSWDISADEDSNVTATLLANGRDLIITGNGAMKDWSFASDVPWRNKIMKVNISDGITKIGVNSFADNPKLIEVNIGTGVKEIGNVAFEKCVSLKNINLPEGLLYIKPEAFVDCVNLINIELPNTLIEIGQGDSLEYGEYQFDVFKGCSSLESITVKPDNSKYSDIDGVLFNKEQTILSVYPEGKKLETYTLPSTTTKINSFAIYNNKELITINLPNSLTSIGDSAFRGCSNLENIDIPINVNCLGSSAFRECSNLKNINVNGNNINYSSDINGVLFDKNKTTIISYPAGKSLTSYTIPDTVNTIGRGAFNNSINLENIYIPNSVTKIEGWAFENCSKLKSIVIPNNVKEMGSEIFGMAFGYIFKGCNSLTDITLPNQVDYFVLGSSFRDCYSLTEITLPNGITKIDSYTFYECFNLTEVTIPEGVTSIGDKAFYKCFSLTEVIIPEGITSIGYKAFAENRNLTNIEISNSVINIGSSIFAEALLTYKIEIGDNEFYEVELPDIIKRANTQEDLLYSDTGFSLTNCELSEDGNEVILNKTNLINGTAKIVIESGKLEDLEINFVDKDFQDIVSPQISEINVAYPLETGDIFRATETIIIDVHFSEFVKGNLPILKLKFGEGTERTAIRSSTISGKNIRYEYIIQKGDNGLLNFVSYEGGQTTDIAGNELEPLNITKFIGKEIFAYTNVPELEMIKNEYYITDKNDLINIQNIINSRKF